MIKRAKKPYPFRPQTYKRLFPRALPWMIKQKVIATLTDLPTALHDIELSHIEPSLFWSCQNFDVKNWGNDSQKKVNLITTFSENCSEWLIKGLLYFNTFLEAGLHTVTVKWGGLRNFCCHEIFLVRWSPFYVFGVQCLKPVKNFMI